VQQLHCERCDVDVDPVISNRGPHLRADCPKCDRFIKFVGKIDAGVEPRTLASRPGITPAQRARVYAKSDHTCVGCGGRPPTIELTIEHLIPREVAYKHGLLDDLIDHELNLVAMCEECNSGRRWVSQPQVALMYRCLQLAARQTEP